MFAMEIPEMRSESEVYNPGDEGKDKIVRDKRRSQVEVKRDQL